MSYNIVNKYNVEWTPVKCCGNDVVGGTCEGEYDTDEVEYDDDDENNECSVWTSTVVVVL
jgi:hypothetical protein